MLHSVPWSQQGHGDRHTHLEEDQRTKGFCLLLPSSLSVPKPGILTSFTVPLQTVRELRGPGKLAPMMPSPSLSGMLTVLHVTVHDNCKPHMATRSDTHKVEIANLAKGRISSTYII